MCLRITCETILRMLSVGLFLYVNTGNMDPLLALVVYYLHVAIMLNFNIIFNSKPPTISLVYISGLLLNSLSSQYTYTYFPYGRRFLYHSDEEETYQTKSHQTSRIRQGVFYVIYVLETLFLTICSLLNFDANKNGDNVMMITDGLGGEFPFSHHNLVIILGIIWILQLLVSPILLVAYYATHPSSVSLTSWTPKLQVSNILSAI